MSSLMAAVTVVVAEVAGPGREAVRAVEEGDRQASVFLKQNEALREDFISAKQDPHTGLPSKPYISLILVWSLVHTHF